MTGAAGLGRRRVRIVLGITILILSAALLVWGFLPARRETRTQPISPTDLQLPTPASFDTQSHRHCEEGVLPDEAISQKISMKMM
jgi:hypothetical protein